MSHNTDNGITCGQFLAYVCTVFWFVGMFSIVWYYEKLAPHLVTKTNPILNCPKHIVKTSCKCGHAKPKIKPIPEPVETLEPAHKHYLETRTNQHLLSGESLTSLSGRYSLQLEHNGSLVVVDNKENKRSIINDGGRWSQGRFKLSLRENSGRLLITSIYGGSVVYSPEFFPSVRNQNYYCDNYYLIMQDDRNAVIYDCRGEALWSSGTAR
jgi:hypothetical protein